APVTGRPAVVWKCFTAVWVVAPKFPSSGTDSPAPLRCCWAHSTRSPLLPLASVANSADGALASCAIPWPTAFHPAADVCFQDHQLRPVAPSAAASWRKRSISLDGGES